MSTGMNSESVTRGLFGRTRTALLSLLYGHPDETYYLRQLVRETGAGNGAIQREVKQLSDAGLIVRKIVGRQILYQANRKSPVFSELRGLLLKTSGVRDVLRHALAPLKNRVRLAFVYGSIATHQERAASDVDLMIVGDVDLGEVSSALSGAEKVLRREINPSVYPLNEFQMKIRAKSHFLTSVLQRKKLFIVGSENDLRELSTKRLAAQASK